MNRTKHPQREALAFDAPHYILQDYLQMRTSLTEQHRQTLLTQLREAFELTGDIMPLIAFKVGKQSVLCDPESTAENCWLYAANEKKLRRWGKKQVNLRRQPYAKQQFPVLSESVRLPEAVS